MWRIEFQNNAHIDLSYLATEIKYWNASFISKLSQKWLCLPNLKSTSHRSFIFEIWLIFISNYQMIDLQLPRNQPAEVFCLFVCVFVFVFVIVFCFVFVLVFGLVCLFLFLFLFLFFFPLYSLFFLLHFILWRHFLFQSTRIRLVISSKRNSNCSTGVYGNAYGVSHRKPSFVQPWISTFITSMIISLCCFHFFKGVIPCSNTTHTHVCSIEIYIGQKYIKFKYICFDVDLYSFVIRACVSRKLNNIHISFILYLIISAESIKLEWWAIW